MGRAENLKMEKGQFRAGFKRFSKKKFWKNISEQTAGAIKNGFQTFEKGGQKNSKKPRESGKKIFRGGPPKTIFWERSTL